MLAVSFLRVARSTSNYEHPRQAIPDERLSTHPRHGRRHLGPRLRDRQKRHRHRWRHLVHRHPFLWGGHRFAHHFISPYQAKFLSKDTEGGHDHRRGHVPRVLDSVSGPGHDDTIEERLFERMLLPYCAVHLVGGLAPPPVRQSVYLRGNMRHWHRDGVADRRLLHQPGRRHKHSLGVPLRRRNRDHRSGHARQRYPDHHRRPAIHQRHLGPAARFDHAAHANGGAGDHSRVHRRHGLCCRPLGGLWSRGAEHSTGTCVPFRGGPALLA